MINFIHLIHPLLAVIAIYPLVGMVVLIGQQTRDRRRGKSVMPPTLGNQHAMLGMVLANAVVVLVLVGLAADLTSHSPSLLTDIGLYRSVVLSMGFAGTGACLLSLSLARTMPARLLMAIVTWIGVITLAAQPEIGGGLENPLMLRFWQGHKWPGVVLTGSLLLSLGIRPEISREMNLRRAHLGLGVFTVLLFVAQAVTGIHSLAKAKHHLEGSHLRTSNVELIHIYPEQLKSQV